MNEFLEAALQYAGRGWNCFPCKPRAKTPLTKRGFLDATISPIQIEAWWRRFPSANVGVATGHVSGLLVLDIDGADGMIALKHVLSLHGGSPLPRAAVSSTGRGWHIWFVLPQGDKVPCSVGQSLEKGLDIRADGGFVIAPPSIHPNGSIYRWVEQGALA